MTTAREIIETMLVRTSEAILANDFEAMNDCFHLPILLETSEQKMVIDSKAAHRALFDKLVEGHKAQKGNDINRLCEVALIPRGVAGRSIARMSDHPFTDLDKVIDQTFADGSVNDSLNTPRLTTTERI